MSEAQARAIVKERSDGMCEVRVPGVCNGRATSVHHRVKRGQGGEWNPSNLLATCGDGTTFCHGWIEAHPKLAQASGWALLSMADPATCAALIHATNYIGANWWLLCEDGSMTWGQTPPHEDDERERYP